MHTSPEITCPYVGLVPFTESQAEFFFGRNREQRIIAANLHSSRLTVLYGASGVGKSSVLRAGVVKTLREEAAETLNDPIAPRFVVVYFAEWSDDPVLSLGHAVAAAVRGLLRETPVTPETQPMTLEAMFRQWHDRFDGEFLVILDQFEEYFRYHPDETGEGTFGVDFPKFINRQDLPVNFLLSIRDDSLDKLDYFKGRIPKLFENYLRIDDLDPSAAREALTKPIAAWNLRSSEKAEIDSDLVEAVVTQVGGSERPVRLGGRATALRSEGQSRRISAAYLQLVMTRLWEEEPSRHPRRLRLALLNQLGGVDKISDRHLERVLQTLSPRQQELAAKLFGLLVTRSGSKHAHFASDLADSTNEPVAEITSLLTQLTRSESRILRAVESSSEGTREAKYEIFHDVLGAPIQKWRERFLAQCEFQQQQRQTEQKLAKAKAQRLVLLGVVGLGVCIGFVMYGLWQNAKNEASRFAMLSVASRLKEAELVSQGDAELKQVSYSSVLQAMEDAGHTAVVLPDGDGIQASDGLRHLIEAWAQVQDDGLCLRDGEVPVAVWAAGDVQEFMAVGTQGTAVRRDADHTLHWKPQVFGPSVTVAAAAYRRSPGEQDQLLIARHDGRLQLWNATALSLIQTFESVADRSGTNFVRRLVWLPDGDQFLVAADNGILEKPGDQGVLKLFSAAKKHAPINLEIVNPIVCVAVSPDGTRIAAASEGADEKTNLMLWGRPNAREAFSSEKKRLEVEGIITAVCFVSGDVLATGSEGGKVRLWDLLSDKEIAELSHGSGVNCLAVSSDGKVLASGGNNWRVRFWDLTDLRKDMAQIKVRETPERWYVHNSPVTHLELSHSDDSGTIVAIAGCDNGFVGRHQWPDRRIERSTFPPKDVAMQLLASTADGELLGRDDSGNLWSYRPQFTAGQTSVWMRLSQGQLQNVSSSEVRVDFSRDGKHLAIAQDKGEISVWKRAQRKDAWESDGSMVVRDLEEQETLSAIRWSPDQSEVAIGTSLGRLLWLARDKKDWRIDDRLPSRHHAGQISAIAFDGGEGKASTQIATTGSGGTELWGLDPKNPAHHKFSETQAKNRTDCALFSPDASVLLVGSRDWFGRLLDPRNPGSKNTMMIRAFSHPSAVRAVAFDKRGKTAFTASVDVVRGWDLATGHQLGPDFDYEGRARFITVLSVNEQETLQLVTNEGVIYHWALPRPATDDFKTLRRQVEYRTMQRLDEDGNRFVLTLDELLEIGKKLGRKSEW